MKKIKTYEPKGVVNRAVIGLHGYTGNDHSLVPIAVGSRCRNTRWYFPEAPHDLRDRDGKTWFIKDASGEWNLTSAFSIVNETLHRSEADGIPVEKTVILGFSQGACLALEFGLRSRYHFGGLIPIAGFIKDPERLGAQLSPANATTPILIIQGTKDTIVPPEKAREVGSFLERQQRPARILWHSAGHKIPIQALRAIKDFVEEI